MSIYPHMEIIFKANCSRKMWLSNLIYLAFAFDWWDYKDQKISNYIYHVPEI